MEKTKSLKIGYCRENFSPDGPVRMNYQLTSTYVLEPICVTALSLSQGDRRVLVIGMDLRNIYKSFISKALPMVMEATGLSEDSVIFTCTHNHSCPEVMIYSDDAIRDWGDRIGFPAIVRAAKKAIGDEKTVLHMEGGRAYTENLNFVRRYQREDGTWVGIATANPSQAPIVAHESQADPELRAVRICREGGKDVILVNYQVHAAGALGKYKDAINADFVGPLRDTLESDGSCHVLYLQGACGNLNYATRIESEKHLAPEGYRQVGEALAGVVRDALSQAQTIQTGKLQSWVGVLDCDVNHTTDHLAPLAQAITDEPDPEKQKEMMRGTPVHGRFVRKAILRRAGMPEKMPMELAAVSFGDLAIAFASVEMFDTNGRQLRDASPFPMTFSCGYSLNCHGYMPSAYAFSHGEYEADICRFLPGTGETIALTLCAKLQEMNKENENE